MGEKILILTGPGDIHALAVAEILRRKGADPVVWYTSDFPMRSRESVLLEDRGIDVFVDGPELLMRGEKFQSVWRRRPFHVIDSGKLHPDDRIFADLECASFRHSLLKMLSPDAFWVNPIEAAHAAGHKLVQHKVALESGCRTAATLYSNDPQRIKEFISRHGGGVVYAPSGKA